MTFAPNDITEQVGGELLKNNLEKNMNKSWYQSRTIWLAIGQGVLGILVALFTVHPELSAVGWIAAVKSLLDIYLRASTA